MRHSDDPRLLDVVEQELGRAQDVEPGELEVVPGRPSIGVGLEQVDLRGGDVQADGLLLPKRRSTRSRYSIRSRYSASFCSHSRMACCQRSHDVPASSAVSSSDRSRLICESITSSLA